MEEKKEIAECEAVETAVTSEAMRLHYRIKADIETASEAIVDFSESLKVMRDRKLYLELECATFGNYTEEWLNIKERQAYNYINNYEQLGKDFLQSNASLGVTKLQLLAAISSQEREIVMEQNDVDNMSVRQLNEALKEIANLKKQLSMFDEEKSISSTVIQQPMEDVIAEIREQLRAEIVNDYEHQLRELQTEISDKSVSEEELKEYKANAEKEAKAAAAAELKKSKAESVEELKKLKADLKAAKDAEKAKADEIKKAQESLKAAEEKLKVSAESEKALTEMKAKIDAAEAEKAALEKKIELSADPEFTRFLFMFEELDILLNDVLAQLDILSDGNKSNAKKAIQSLLGRIK